jgi:hypothetical protein
MSNSKIAKLFNLIDNSQLKKLPSDQALAKDDLSATCIFPNASPARGNPITDLISLDDLARGVDFELR